MTFKQVKLEELYIGTVNMREDMGTSEDREALRASLKNEGLIHPLVVRKTEKGYEIVTGTRRYQELKELGTKTVQVKVEELDDVNAITMSLQENERRKTINDGERGKAYSALLNLLGSTQKVAEKVNQSKDHIDRCLESYVGAKAVKDAGIDVSPRYTQVETGDKNKTLPRKHSMALGKLMESKQVKRALPDSKDREKKIQELATSVLDKGITVAELQRVAERIKEDVARPVAEVVDEVLNEPEPESELRVSVYFPIPLSTYVRKEAKKANQENSDWLRTTIRNYLATLGYKVAGPLDVQTNLA